MGGEARGGRRERMTLEHWDCPAQLPLLKRRIYFTTLQMRPEVTVGEFTMNSL